MAFSQRSFAVQLNPAEFLLQDDADSLPAEIIPFAEVTSNKNKSLPKHLNFYRH